MAQSPAHKFGQIVGDLLEDAIRPMLQKFAKKHGLYLDMKGERRCRRGRKCSWKDSNNNSHDLDFVLERGRSSDKMGMPVAFIETAWRRYTKHSRNKAQEIQGAILPLAETYRNLGPFKGAVLAGVFTEGALAQLRSIGFNILYFPHTSVFKAFQEFGVNADFDERTSDRDFQRKINAFTRLSVDDRSRIAARLLKLHAREAKAFMLALSSAVLRQIERIVILILHGGVQEVATVDEAVRFILGYSTEDQRRPIHQYEIEVRYNNGNMITAKFFGKQDAVEFLRGFEPVTPTAD
jgi:hypothetical protein